MPTPFIERLSRAVRLDEPDLAALRALEDQKIDHYEPGKSLLFEGQEIERAGVIAEGWATRELTLTDGRRQIVDLFLPGSFIALQALSLEYSDFDAVALTPIRLSWFSTDRIEELFRAHPRAGLAILWSAAQEEAILAERVRSLGVRTAKERVAHIFMEIGRRLHRRGLMQDNRYRLPVTKTTLADMLGISAVHMSRVLKELRQEGFVEESKGGVIDLANVAELSRLAHFDANYLHEKVESA